MLLLAPAGLSIYCDDAAQRPGPGTALRAAARPVLRPADMELRLALRHLAGAGAAPASLRLQAALRCRPDRAPRTPDSS